MNDSPGDRMKGYIEGPVTIEFRQCEPKPFSNPYYTVEPVMKRVNKEEFNAWLKAYPRHLEVDVTGICDPPSISYNDFELADRWPSSVVASTYAYDDDPEGYYYTPEEERTYSVMANYEEVFASKTGYTAPKHNETQCGTVYFKTFEGGGWSEPVFAVENVQLCNFTEGGNSISDA